MKLFIFVIFVCLYGLSYSFIFPKKDLEIYMNISEAIKYYGYPCEVHSVVTEDGYVLSMQRILRGKENKEFNGTRPVALLQHGLLDSAHTWVMNMPYQSLGFILADMGFDVWLSNSRGSTYSKKHRRLSPNSKEFWDFSFDEMAEYDLPAFIHYALKISNATTLHYVGHSQGSLMGFAKFSKDKTLASLVSSFVALGPVTTINHIGLVPKLALKTITTFSPIINFWRNGEFMPSTALIQTVANLVCTKNLLTPVCSCPIFWLAGSDVSNLNNSRLPVIIGHTPAGTSMKNVIHWNQLALSGKFQMYDYGSPKKNLNKYGTPIAPLYDVTGLDVPLSMYWGGNDILATPADVKSLIPLVNKTIISQKFIPYYNHMDYVWGVNAHDVIYQEVVRFMKTYSP